MSRDPILREGHFHTRKVQALGGLHFIRGNAKPYFSLTMASWQKMPSGRLVEDCFGAAHEDLVRWWPELKPLADLHLADIDGMPMHAVSNGWYWLEGAAGGFGSQFHGSNGDKTQDECLGILAKHLRIGHNEARGLVVAAIDLASREGKKAASEMLSLYVVEQLPRWKREADECIKALDLKVFGDEWKEAA